MSYVYTGTLANACPTCKAEIGKRCRAKTGGETEPHKARRALPAPETASKPAYQPGQRDEYEEPEPGELDELEDARRVLRNHTFGIVDPCLDPIEVIRGIVDSTATYYTVDQWSEREDVHDKIVDDLREELSAAIVERQTHEKAAELAGGRAEQLEVDLRVSVETSGLMLADLTKARDRVLELERLLKSSTFARVDELERRLAEIRDLTNKEI